MKIYRQILKKAFDITFNNKHLWFFGLFVSFLGISGEYLSVYKAFQRLQQTNPLVSWWNDFLFEVGVPASVLWQGFKEILLSNPFQLAMPFLILVAFLIIIIFLIWLIIVSQGGLIEAVSKIYKKKTSVFSEDLRSGMINFNKIFGLNLIERIIIYILLLLVGVFSFLIAKVNIALGLLIILLVFVLMILIMIASFIIKYAICYSVISDKGFKDSIILAYDLFKKNWLLSIELAIILLLISFGAFILLVILSFLIILPFVLIMFICSVLEWSGLFMLFMFVGILVLFLFLLLFWAWLAVFQWSSWAVLFMELEKDKIESKISRVMQGVFGKK